MSDCFECGAPAKHQHHIIPKSLGGTKTVPLCGLCHPKAHGKTDHWKVGELVRQAHARKKANNEWCGGNIPYGFEQDGHKLIPLRHEFEVIKRIFILSLAGWSWRRIAMALNSQGIATKTKRGVWHHSLIKQILHRRRVTRVTKRWQYKF